MNRKITHTTRSCDLGFFLCCCQVGHVPAASYESVSICIKEYIQDIILYLTVLKLRLVIDHCIQLWVIVEGYFLLL